MKLTTLGGGKGDLTRLDQVDPVQLSLGIQIEMEHTNDPNIAQEISMDHLTEDPNYYTKLIKAGLADEFKGAANSGLGDPNQSFNDPARIGDGGLLPGNIKGTIGGTNDGQVIGRSSKPVVDKSNNPFNGDGSINKTIDIELQERRKKQVQHTIKKIKNGVVIQKAILNTDSTSQSSHEDENNCDFSEGVKIKENYMKQDRLKEIISTLVQNQLREQSENELPKISPSDLNLPTKKHSDSTDVDGKVTITINRDTAQTLHDLLMKVLHHSNHSSEKVPTETDNSPSSDLVDNEESVGEITPEQSSDIDEAKKKWIQNAIKPNNKGMLRKQLGVSKAEKIPKEKLAAAAKKGGKLGKRARLAITLSKLKKK